MGYLDFLLLGYSGRIGRATYWLSYLVLGVVQCLVIWGLLQLSHGSVEQLAQYTNGRDMPIEALQTFGVHVMLPICIVGLLFLWPQYAIATKRWHDRGKSGWWSLIVLVPIVGGLWALIELGFLPGEEGVNAYGYR
jgi:uncharacterized membrane protein YhaH (DUF805 family)